MVFNFNSVGIEASNSITTLASSSKEIDEQISKLTQNFKTSFITIEKYIEMLNAHLAKTSKEFKSPQPARLEQHPHISASTNQIQNRSKVNIKK